MTLGLIILILIAGGVLAWALGRVNEVLARAVSLLAIFVDLILTISLLAGGEFRISGGGAFVDQLKMPWIPQLGISLHFGADGLSLLLLLLTMLLGIVSVLVSWREITERVGFFHFNLLLVLAGIAGVFTALDLFLFYFFWELMLIPMYFLIAVWGHEKRVYASIKFFIFTQAGGLLMLLSILGLFYLHGQDTGVYTFDYFSLVGTRMPYAVSFWLMLGFLAGFLVKVPAVPVHSWLPDAHTEAPTAGSVVLAGLLLKTGAYGLIRFVVPFFPDASAAFAPVGMALGVAGIIYGAVLAFGQTDMKRLIANSSISHMGFVILGIYAWNTLALQGAVIQMLCHGISTGMLFVIAGALQDRLHTREMARMGGLWDAAPALSGVALFFAMASLGLPGLGNFVAEFLVLMGTFRSDMVYSVLASTGFVLSTIYSLSFVSRVFHGRRPEGLALADLSPREGAVSLVMIALILWIGLYPQPILRVSGAALKEIELGAAGRQMAETAVPLLPEASNGAR